MRAPRLAAALFAFGALGASGRARAELPPSAPVELALVVGNNRGTSLGRADLHYADDDGAKYRVLFGARAERPSDVRLLTRFDRDSARLFDGGPGGPGAPDGPPTRAAVEAAVGAFAARAAELRRAGRTVRFTFVYAGHGDVDRGRGFVELEDGAFGADDLAAAVKRVDAQTAHVVLDSCNSVFLVSPRKPGGRHVATSDDAVEALRARLPRVGVFLSTSPDGEVFEWSELGAGIFSHAVRSGLAGAADANGDGAVTYAELRAFVEVATREVKNPRYRPRVFARGPDGDDGAVLFAPRAAAGRKLVLEGPVRTTLRDADDVPWLDANVEAGARTTVLVPTPLDDGRGTQELLAPGPGPRRVLARRALDDGATPRSEERVAARGGGEVFGALFARPFGPRAFAEAAPGERDAASTYGISRDDVSRFGALTDEVAATDRARRVTAGWALFGGALVSGGMGALVLVRGRDDAVRALGSGYLATGAGMLVAAPLVGLRRGAGETLRDGYASDLARGVPAGDAVARAETRLFELARRERTYRTVGVATFGVLLAAQAATFTINELGDRPDPYLRGVLATGALVTAVGGALYLQPTPTERLVDLWRAEPTRQARSVSLVPVGPGGPGLTLGGTF